MASCFLSFGLIVLRVMVTKQIGFLFLVWNLFLAFIPFFISSWLYLFKHRFSKITMLPFVALWLLFFPNAPYIITDIIHLHPDKSFNYWYNLLIVVSTAWNALILGLLSLNDIQNVVADKFNKHIAWLFSITSLFLGAFGIYLGRILRWNSWDLFFDTKSLLFLTDSTNFHRILNTIHLNHLIKLISGIFLLFLLHENFLKLAQAIY